MFIMIMALFGRFCIASAFIVIILHTAELFPTEIRNSAIGTSSMTAHIGSISAPYVVDIVVSTNKIALISGKTSKLIFFRVPLLGLFQRQYVPFFHWLPDS